MSELHACPSKEILVAVLYDEATADERRLVNEHTATCAECRDELTALNDARGLLGEWHAPTLTARFRVVAEPAPAEDLAAGNSARVLTGPGRWFSSRAVAAAAFAAAATLVLGVSAGLANLDVRFGGDGVTVRTGWNHDRAVAVPAAPSPLAAPVAATSAARPSGSDDVALVRAELVALEKRMRSEMDARVAKAPGPTAALAATRGEDEAVLRRVQALIDAAEVRQQQNLALRMTELARDFDVQRKTDFVRIQQGLGKLEGRAEAEAARNQQLMNYIVRVSSPQR
jgi:hypothetical protein